MMKSGEDGIREIWVDEPRCTLCTVDVNQIASRLGQI